jgi:hypothetical protein
MALASANSAFYAPKSSSLVVGSREWTISMCCFASCERDLVVYFLIGFMVILIWWALTGGLAIWWQGSNITQNEQILWSSHFAFVFTFLPRILSIYRQNANVMWSYLWHATEEILFWFFVALKFPIWAKWLKSQQIKVRIIIFFKKIIFLFGNIIKK